MRRGFGALAGIVMGMWTLGASAGALDIREGYVRELPPGQTTSAAYMKLVNTGTAPLTIVGASSNSAARAEIHSTRQRDGMMQMESVARVPVPAHGEVALAPGGYHLMLIDLKQPLRAGDKVDITLRDERGGAYTATLPVVKMLGEAGAAPHHH